MKTFAVILENRLQEEEDAIVTKKRRLSESKDAKTPKKTQIAANIVEKAQPFSFLLTKVTGIEAKYNQFQAIDIKGDILSVHSLLNLHYVLSLSTSLQFCSGVL